MEQKNRRGALRRRSLLFSDRLPNGEPPLKPAPPSLSRKDVLESATKNLEAQLSGVLGKYQLKGFKVTKNA